MYGTALEIPAMKISKLPKGKEYMRKRVCNSGEYVAQIKKDGALYIFEKDSEGKCWLFSRILSVKTGHLTEKSSSVPHIVEALKNIPNGTILIGEIYYPGGCSNDVTSVMGCLPEKAVEKQKDKPLHYYIHDMIYLNGESLMDKGFGVRHYELWKMLYDNKLLVSIPQVEFAQVYSADEWDLEKLIDDLIEGGEEGVVLKRRDGKYFPDKRPAWVTLKFKREDEADVICMGYDPPNKIHVGTGDGEDLTDWNYWELTEAQPGEKSIYMDGRPDCPEDFFVPVTKAYAMGWIGSIKFGAFRKKIGEFYVLGEIGTVSSGLTEELLEQIKNNPDDFIGKPMKVSCMQTFGGALRHPALVGFRDDIDPKDCTWEKIFE